MTVLRGQDSKVLRGVSGEVFDENAADSKLVLKIDTDQQTPNRLFYDGTGLVQQVTDKAQNIPFTQPDLAKRPVLNITEGAFEFDGVKSVATNKSPLRELGNNTWIFQIAIYPITWDSFAYIFGDFIDNSNTSLVLYSISDVGDLRLRMTNTTGGIKDLEISGVPLNEWSVITYTRRPNGLFSAFRNGIIEILQADWNFPIRAQDIPCYLGNTNAANPNQNILVSKVELILDKFIDTAGKTTGEQLFNPNLQPFPYFKRYKEDGNKKLYISSRYLEGADIDRNGEISLINSEIKSMSVGSANSVIDEEISQFKLLQTGISPIVLDNGLRLNGGSSTQYELVRADIINQRIYANNFNDFYFGTWFNPLTDNGSQFFLRLQITDVITSINQLVFEFVYNFQANKILFWNQADLKYSINIHPINEWIHLSAIKKNGIIYYFVNGILQTTHNDTANYTNTRLNIFYQNTIGGSADSLKIDDILLSTGDSIINPTGYAIGEKCFVPPSRKSLDSRFIQL